MREHWGRALLDFAFAEPRAMDLVVSDAPRALRDLVKAYPAPWARASSASPRRGFPSSGLVLECGIVCAATPLAEVPQLLVWGNRASIYGPGDSLAAPEPRPRLAITGDAILVRSGEAVDAHPGDSEDSLVGVGVMPSGVVLHAVATLATSGLLARFFVEQGCREALLVTSGESCGLLVYGDRRLGRVDGLERSAIIIRHVVLPHETLLTSRFVR